MTPQPEVEPLVSVIPMGHNTSIAPCRLFKFESVQPSPTFVKSSEEKTKGWEGGFFQSPYSSKNLSF